MVFFNDKEKNEPKRIVGGFLGNPQSNEKSNPVIRDVVSKEDNVIKLGEPLKKQAVISKPASPFAEKFKRETVARGRRLSEMVKTENVPLKLPIKEMSFLRPEILKYSLASRRIRLFSTIGSIVIFIASVALFSYAFSRANLTVKVKLTTVPLSQTVITVDPKAQAVNINSKRLPGLYIEANRSVVKNFEAKTVGYTESRARGSITIFNNFGTSPQVLIKTTRFESKSTGLVFRLQETITVPGTTKQSDKLIPGSVRAEVMADEIGEKYNIAPDDFVIPAFKGSSRYQGFYAKSLERFRGGLKGAGAMVTVEELQKAEEVVTAEVFEKAKEELSSKIPPGFKLLPGARAIKVTKVSKPHAGEAVRTFTVASDATASATLFKEDDLFLLLSKLVIKEGSLESIVKQKSDVFKDISQLNFDFDSRLLTFNLASNLVLSYEIDQVKLKKEIGGKSKSEVETILRSKPELTGHILEISPFWIKKVPSNPKKVNIRVEM